MGAHPPPKAEVRGSNPLECAISQFQGPWAVDQVTVSKRLTF